MPAALQGSIFAQATTMGKAATIETRHIHRAGSPKNTFKNSGVSSGSVDSRCHSNMFLRLLHTKDNERGHR